MSDPTPSLPYAPPKPMVKFDLDPIGKGNEDLECVVCLRAKCDFSTSMRANGRIYVVGVHAGCAAPYRVNSTKAE